MYELWQVITRGTWRERRTLAAYGMLLVMGAVALYSLAWWGGGAWP